MCAEPSPLLLVTMWFKYNSNIIKFSDDTTVIGLIANNHEIAYREEEVRALSQWCKDNGLSVNVKKTKEFGYRRQEAGKNIQCTQNKQDSGRKSQQLQIPLGSLRISHGPHTLKL